VRRGEGDKREVKGEVRVDKKIKEKGRWEK
jgi:hypothetical protein